jgi:hypothetical protein
MNEQYEQDKLRVVKEELAQHGVSLSGRAVQHRLLKADERASKEAQEQYPNSVLESKVAVARIRKMLGWLAVFFVATFLVFGNVLSIILFPVAEFLAVRAGIMAFESHAALATLNAAVVVIGLVSLLFIRNLLRDNLPDEHPIPRNSLRQSWQQIRHFVFGTTQQDSTLRSEALYLASSGAVTLLQVVIVLLGFMGRVRDAMGASAEKGETYYTFVASLFVEATAVEFVGYVGTILLTIALLKVTDLVVLFIYNVFTSTVGQMDLNADNQGELRRRFFGLRRLELQTQYLADYLLQVKARNK